MRRSPITWRSIVTAVGFACLMASASLAGGAGRIDNRLHFGHIKIVTVRLAPAVGLAAGDRDERILDLKTGGRSRVKLVVSSWPASLLVDPTLGLRLRIERCAKKWRKRGHTWSCHGRTSTVLSGAPALGRHVLRKLARRGQTHLRLTLTLPRSAPNSLQGLTAHLLYRFR
jgi:hypothetical protein